MEDKTIHFHFSARSDFQGGGGGGITLIIKGDGFKTPAHPHQLRKEIWWTQSVERLHTRPLKSTFLVMGTTTCRPRDKMNILQRLSYCHYNYKFSLEHFSFEEEFREITHMYIRLHAKYPSFSPDSNETWISSTHFRKILKPQISLKSV